MEIISNEITLKFTYIYRYIYLWLRTKNRTGGCYILEMVEKS